MWVELSSDNGVCVMAWLPVCLFYCVTFDNTCNRNRLKTSIVYLFQLSNYISYINTSGIYVNTTTGLLINVITHRLSKTTGISINGHMHLCVMVKFAYTRLSADSCNASTATIII